MEKGYLNARALALFILALSSLGIAAYLYDKGDTLNLNLDYFSLPTGFFASNNKEYVKAQIDLNGSFSSMNEIEINSNTAIEIPGGSSIQIDNVIVKNKNNKGYYLKELAGFLLYNKGKITLKGKCSNIISQSEEISKDNRIDITYNGTFNKIEIENIEGDIILDNYRGTIKTTITPKDIVSYIVLGKKVEIKSFKGNIILTPGKIVLKGKGLIKTDVLSVKEVKE